VFASLVVLYALRVAQQPPDAEHPYGHTRADAIGGSNVAVLVIVSALFVGWEAVQRIGTPHEVPPVWTLWIAAGNVVIKEGLFRYKRGVSRRTGSLSIEANAWDHRSDAFCSLAVLAGLAGVWAGGPAWAVADHLAALVVVGFIVWSAVGVLRQSASELMDVQADEPFVRQIRAAAEAVPRVRAVEKLWVRKSGLECFVDIHIQVDPALSVAEGHEIGHAVKDRLVARFEAVRDVLVHLEPHPHTHPAAALDHSGASPETLVETALYGADLAALEAFYATVLLLPVVAREPGRHVFFRAGPGSMLLVFNPEATQRGEGLPPHGSIGAGHVAFGIEEHRLDFWRTRLAAHGVAIEKEIVWPRGGTSLYFRDPAGNSVELITRGVWGLPDGW
jgi:cation diffusion facilitator family transporter